MPGTGLPRDPNRTGIHRGVQHSATYTRHNAHLTRQQPGSEYGIYVMLS